MCCSRCAIIIRHMTTITAAATTTTTIIIPIQRMTRIPSTSLEVAVVNVSMLVVFLPARRYASAGLCDSDVSVRPSVRPSVTRRYCA